MIKGVLFFENIYRVGHLLTSWFVNMIILFTFKIAHAQSFFLHYKFFVFLHSYSIGPANSSVGRVSDCSSEGRRFEPDLADIKTSLTQLVECQPHELKAMGSIPTHGK